MKFLVEDPQEAMNEYVCYENDFGNYVVLIQFTYSLMDNSPNDDQYSLWEIHFTRARSRRGNRAGIVFTSPESDLTS